MTLVQKYNGDLNFYTKGRFCNAPATMIMATQIIIRPTYDDYIKCRDHIPGDIIYINNLNDPYNHMPFEKLKIKQDEELVAVKAKKRRALCLSDSIYGQIKIAPVYTLKDYHKEKYDLDKLKNNELRGILYLPFSEYNKESFVPLIEGQAIWLNLLNPLRVELTKDGHDVLDDHLTDFYQLYSR